MAFGVKSVTVRTRREYTFEEFYDAIKNATFTAGKPEITKQMARLVTFPPLDSHNQVQIIKGELFSKRCDKFIVQKAEAAGWDNVVGNMAKDFLTDGLIGIRQLVGNTAELCEKLVEITAQELEALDL